MPKGGKCLSAQVLSEFFTIITRKGASPRSADAGFTETSLLAAHHVVSLDEPLVLLAIKRMQRHQISYWDALIVEAALHAGASILYTEDLQHGMRFDALEVRNPFLV